MTLSLDANVCVDLMRAKQGHLRVRWHEAQASGEMMKLSTIVLHELLRGVHLSARPARQQELLQHLLSTVDVEPWAEEDAAVAARLDASLKKGGTRIGAYDILIAGQALQRGWKVVTANAREFIRVPGLHIIDWSDPAGPIDVTGAMASLRRPTKD